MQREDRRVIYAIVVVGAILAVELAVPRLSSVFDVAPCQTIRGSHPAVATGGAEALRRSPQAAKPNENCDSDALVAEYTRQVALYTGWLFFATIIVAAIGLWSSWIAKQSADFIPLVERAYVFAKVKGSGRFLDNSQFPDQFRRPYHVVARFVNRGKTPAMIKMLRAYPVIARAPPSELNNAPGTDAELPQGLIIKADGARDVPMDVLTTRDEATSISARELKIYCVGKIEYKDILGQRRETGFCWHYEPHGAVGRFVITPNTKLNYHR